jgi:CHAT domain-containing protein/tetratricopeptide (TPR) repeat protein
LKETIVKTPLSIIALLVVIGFSENCFATRIRFEAELAPRVERTASAATRLVQNTPNQSNDLDELWTQMDRLVQSQRYGEAASIGENVVERAKQRYGETSGEYKSALSNLGMIYHQMGRPDKAAPLLEKAKNIAVTDSKSDEFETLKDKMSDLFESGQYTKAIPLAAHLVELARARAPGTDVEAEMLHDLGVLYLESGQFVEAANRLKEAYDLRARLLPADHPYLALTGHKLANAEYALGRREEAAILYQKVLPIRERLLGIDADDVIKARCALVNIYMERADWDSALEQTKKVTDALQIKYDRLSSDTSVMREVLEAQARRQLSQFRSYFILEVWLSTKVANPGPTSVAESFYLAQIAADNSAGDAIERTAARLGPRTNSHLLELVHRLSLPEFRRSELFTHGFTADDAAQIAALEKEIEQAKQNLKSEFPEYAALTLKEPMTLASVQALLRATEAIVVFLDTPEQFGIPEASFAWVATATNARLVRITQGTEMLRKQVSALRCGLDYTNWTQLALALGGRCKQLPDVEISGGDLPPFDLERAHALYKTLFDQIEDLIKDRELLIVPSGPLTQLPFQVLVTEPPNTAISKSPKDYRNVAWLARKHAITVLPAVSSLKALRQFAKESHASEPYIGFGNPLLKGESPKDEKRATLAQEKQRCEPTLRKRLASLFGFRGGTRAMRDDGGTADIGDIRKWVPLPETADELCDVADDLGVDPAAHVYLGAKATETEIKRLSADGTLAKYKIVHFATHGAIAGDLSGTSEPGLILTPPDKATELDDGYLSASEIAALKIDADWVILSACNTAAGEAKGAEALSGLARAFFYAGARSLLVSHWEVDSESTVKLITKAIAELKADPKIGRAEALRRSMLSLIAVGEDYEAHPAFWAPFVLVGEGDATP